jgi:hypothetical protein
MALEIRDEFFLLARQKRLRVERLVVRMLHALEGIVEHALIAALRVREEFVQVDRGDAGVCVAEQLGVIDTLVREEHGAG